MTTREVSIVRLALAFEEWMKRYQSEPEQFHTDWLKDEPKSYGDGAAKYLVKLLDEIPLVLVLMLLVAAPAFAQDTTTTYNPPKPPPPAPCKCEPTPPWTLRPYDLTLPAWLVTLRGVVPVPGGHLVMVYSAPLRHAALIDPRTGLAQIVPIDPKFHGNVVADGFRAITPTFYEWTAGDVTWGEPWRAEWPWTPMPGWTWRQ